MQELGMFDSMKLSEAQQHFSEIVNRVSRGGGRVLVEDRGVPVAAIVSAADLARLNQLDVERAERFKVIDEMQAAFQGVPSEAIEREAERALAEVRAEIRTERE